MKKVLLFFLALTFTATLSAQKNKVTTAWSELNAYHQDKDPFHLGKAKQNIDDAAVNADTKDNAKTWAYRGNVYHELYLVDYNKALASITDEPDPGKKQTKAYTLAPVANLNEAIISYLKARQLDTRGDYSDDITTGINDCYRITQQAGIAFFYAEKYGDAFPLFENAVNIAASSKKIDTMNTSNAANSAFNAKDYEHAIIYCQKLTDYKYGKGKTWMMLGQCYLGKGDTAKYHDIIAQGLKMYPTDGDLLVEDVNIKMGGGHIADAVSELNALIAQRPTDPDLNFLVGNVYDRLANPKTPEGKLLDKPANYEDMVNKAADYYKKTIDLKADYTDAYFNLGVLYYNQSYEYYNRSISTTIADAAKYRDLWQKPLPDALKYLLKAQELNPKDINTMIALKNVYGMMSDNDNYNKMKQAIKDAQGGK